MPDFSLPRLDLNAVATVAAAATSGATTISITPNSVLPTTGVYPIGLMIGGERITVASASISGANLVLAGCTRAVNGIVKAHVVGEAVTLANPYRLTLGNPRHPYLGGLAATPPVTGGGTFPTTTYFEDFATLGAYTVLNSSDWAVYNSVGNAGFGLRRPSQVNVETDGTETSNGKVLAITAQNVGGVHYSGGLQLYGQPRTYGQYELSVRCDDDATSDPGGPGVTSGVIICWPASNQWPRDGELDWWETYDHRDTRTPVQTNVHRLNPAAPGPTYTSADDELAVSLQWAGVDQSAWHKIVCSWSPTQLFIEIDNTGQQLITSDPANIPDWPMNLTIQLDAWSNTPPVTPVKLRVGYVLIRDYVP